jgi:hypothetical protein
MKWAALRRFRRRLAGAGGDEEEESREPIIKRQSADHARCTSRS